MPKKQVVEERAKRTQERLARKAAATELRFQKKVQAALNKAAVAAAKAKAQANREVRAMAALLPKHKPDPQTLAAQAAELAKMARKRADLLQDEARQALAIAQVVPDDWEAQQQATLAQQQALEAKKSAHSLRVCADRRAKLAKLEQ